MEQLLARSYPQVRGIRATPELQLSGDSQLKSKMLEQMAGSARGPGEPNLTSRTENGLSLVLSTAHRVVLPSLISNAHITASIRTARPTVLFPFFSSSTDLIPLFTHCLCSDVPAILSQQKSIFSLHEPSIFKNIFDLTCRCNLGVGGSHHRQ